MRLFEAIDENLRASLSMFGMALNTGARVRTGGLDMVASGVKFTMFNTAAICEPVLGGSDLVSKIQRSEKEFRDRKLPWSFWMCCDWLPPDVSWRAPVLCGDCGLYLVADLPAMAAERVLPPSRPLPRIECRHVQDAQSRALFAQMMSVCFGIPFSIAHDIYESEQTWRGPFAGYVGLVDGEPVSTAGTVIAGGVIGIYSVATLPGREHCGYAEAITRHALDRARYASGIEQTILQSTSEGLNLYRKLGFKEVSRYSVYAARTA